MKLFIEIGINERFVDAEMIIELIRHIPYVSVSKTWSEDQFWEDFEMNERNKEGK